MMSFIIKFVALYRSFLRIFAEVSSILIFIMVFLITGDVFGRFALNSPIAGTLEIAQSMMVFIVFLVYAHTQATDQNIRIGLIDKIISERQKLYLNLLAYALAMFVFGVICLMSWKQATYAWEINQRMSGLLRIPTWPAKSAVVLGSFLLVVEFFIGFVSSLYSIVKKDDIER